MSTDDAGAESALRPTSAEAQSPHIGNLIRRAQQLHLTRWAQVVSVDITSAQYTILEVLNRFGEASQRELCTEVDLDRSTVADLVRRMELAGLITRTRAAEDARRNVVALTDRGLTELVRLTPLVDALRDDLTGHLDPDAATALIQGLQQLLDRN